MRKKENQAELVVANTTCFQDIEKKKTAELAVANTELTFKIKKKKNELQN
jgi:hypothetical protein